MSGEFYELGHLKCPKCDGSLDMASAEEGEDRSPRADDQTVCAHCLCFMRFVEPAPGMLALELISTEEFDGMSEFRQRDLLQTQGRMRQSRMKIGIVELTNQVLYLNDRLEALERLVEGLADRITNAVVEKLVPEIERIADDVVNDLSGE